MFRGEAAEERMGRGRGHDGRKVSFGQHFGSLIRTKGSRIRMAEGKDVSLGGLFSPSLFQSPLSGKWESLSFYYGNLNLL